MDQKNLDIDGSPPIPWTRTSPWHLYAVAPAAAFRVATDGTPGATRWSFGGGEKARLLRDDPDLLKVTAEIPMTPVQQLLSQGQLAAAEQALEELQSVPPPSPPSASYLTPRLTASSRLKVLIDQSTPRTPIAVHQARAMSALWPTGVPNSRPRSVSIIGVKG